MSKQITIRGISPQLAGALDDLARRQGTSVNAAVLRLLEDALGVNARQERFRRFATMGPEEGREVNGVIREQRQIDDDLWR